MARGAISKADLFARLAQGHAAGVTVVTPNRRLAQTLRAEFDVYQTGQGKTVWEDADILPYASFLERMYEDALYADGGAALPMLLSPAQARELWEEAIRASSWAGSLLDVPRTASRAADAWQRAQEWGIAGALEKFSDTEDTRAFTDWARAYAQRLKKDGLVDHATLPALGLKAPKTKLLVAYAFDILAPQTQDVLGDFLDCTPEKTHSDPIKSSFASPKDELESSARWARAQLEAGKKKIGVVVPELERRRREVARVFARVMGSPAPFNISIGEPLSGYPIVAFALSLLEFTVAEKRFEDVSRLLRSPFLAGAETELAARARLDARLRRKAPAVLSLGKLIGLLDEGTLRARLENIFQLKAERQSPQLWAQHFTAVLDAAGFPGERTLDSAEFQTRARFNEMLGELARLGVVSKSFSSQKAVAQLRRLCNEALFQPESPDAPVQVLGLLESAGLAFDALWLSGLTDEAWPLRARPSPFLPLALQRKAGIPEASAESALALDARLTDGWAQAAREVIFSWPRRIDDRDLVPSALIAKFKEGQSKFPDYPRWRDAIFAARAIESLEDAKSPPLADMHVRGGTRVLSDQAACPFRAFARWRLGAEALDSPAPGPDAMDRGTLLHVLMAGIWREAKTIEGLNATLIANAARKAVQEIGLEGRFADIETQRLIRLAGEWLDIERTRTPFEVLSVEEKRKIGIGGLELDGRIDRLDRLADGSHAVIDYKTGSRVTANDWRDKSGKGRPDDPQLPLYVLSAREEVSALAFAKLRAGDMKFSGFSRDKKVIPDVKQAESWDGLLKEWQRDLTGLAASFAAGEAAVDPKYQLKTCSNCDLHPLCRVHERLGALDEAGAAEEDA
jgi:ATP-dependent helicase/nuclease subunit B